MFTCETCNKDYASQKRYLAHIEKCEDSLNRSRRSTHSVATLTDIEDEPSRSRSRSTTRDLSIDRSRSMSRSHVGSNMSKSETIERLMQDKTKYKSELKKYRGELRSRVEEHRTELERTQEYFQDQIISLTQERDELADKVNTARETIFDEKERLRSEFANKVNSEKKRLESRYGSKNSAVVRLEASLEKLQERLNQQLEEKERMREEFHEQSNIQEEQYRLKLEELQEEMRKLRHNIGREREDLRRSAQLFQSEKDTAMTILRREKDQEIQNVIVEKDTIIQAMTHNMDNLKKEKEIVEKQHKREQEDNNCAHQIAIQERNNTINRLKDTHARSIEQMKINYEGKVNSLAEKHSRDINLLKKEQEKEIESKVYSHDIEMKNTKNATAREIQELNSEIAANVKKIHDTEENYKNQIMILKQDHSNNLSELKRTNTQEIEIMEKELKKNHREGVRDRDETIAELERLNHALGSQIGHFRSAMDNMKQDTSRIKQQFITTLNRQKEEEEKTLRERDVKITELENNLRTLQDRNAHQMEDARNKLNILTNEISTEKIKSKTAEDAHNDMQLRLRETEKALAEVDKNHEAHVRHLKNDFSTKMNDAVDIARIEYGDKLNMVEKLLENTSQELVRVKTESSEVLNSQRRELLDHTEKEIKAMREVVEEHKNTSASLNQELINTRQQFVAQMNDVTTKNKNITEELQKKLETAEDDLKRAQQTIQNNKQQFSEQLNRLSQMSNPEKEELKRIRSEIVNKDEQIEKLKQISLDLNTHITKQQNYENQLRHDMECIKTEFEKEKVELVKKAETPIRDTSMEDKMKKMRDDCLASIRKQKIELADLKAENLRLKREIVVVNETAQERNKTPETTKNT